MSSVEKLRSTLEAAGVAFIAENGGGVGVRFREPKVKKQTESLNPALRLLEPPLFL